ncbi:MAG: tetratricopeptide repeat protein [Ignavibacteriales bacterium]|nr:tetratricopeptide repeat protein [Ignavibacteriales bacterium]
MKKSVIFSLLVGCLAIPAAAQVSATDSVMQAGIKYYMEGRHLEALQALLAAKADSGSASMRFYLGSCYAAINNFALARRYLKESIALDSSNLSFRFQYARTLSNFGSLQEAQSAYESIIRMDSSFIPALFQLGVIFHDQRDFPRSIRFFTRVLTANPADFFGQYYLGSSFVGLGKQDTAELFLRKSLELNQTFVPALVGLGSIQIAKKNWLEVLYLFERASALRPSNADYVYRIGQCYREFNDHIRAVAFFKKAAELDTSNALYLAQIGFVYYHLKQYPLSVDAYKKAIIIDDSNPVYYINLALSYVRMDSTELAIKAYEKAIAATNPNQVAKLYVDLGSMLAEKKRYREAVKAYQRAAEIDPLNRDAWFFIAWTHDQAGDSTAAMKGYERYLGRTPPDSVGRSRKTLIDMRMKRWKKK